jgi:hypothetical protein
MRFLQIASLAVVAALGNVSTAEAQLAELRGIVRDSASRAPVPGAVVMELDAAGQVVVRTIAAQSGQYRIARAATATQLRVVRLGFRPTTVAIPPLQTAVTAVDVIMAPVARALDAVDVVAARGCPVRSDRSEAFALLDQARAGLLASVVAREKQPATLRVIRYERHLDLDGIEIERQTVQIDSSRKATTSFNAVQSAVDFVEKGFRMGRDGNYTFFGPDADVLLDERFQRGYCFSVAARDTARSAQVGLHFAPAGRRNDRVDIDGTLWIDTANRVLRDIEFRYVGLEVLAESFGAGGSIGFRTLPSGVPFIERWSMRMVGAPDTIVTDAGASAQAYAIREVGGELAEARWPDGQVWRATLGTVQVTAVRRNGEPAKAVTLNLAGTDYHVTTDSLGRATINQLVPGPYRFAVEDPRLAPIKFQVPTSRTFTSRRSSTSLVRVETMTAEEFVADQCESKSAQSNDALLIARIVGSDGNPLGGTRWRVSESRDGRWRVLSDNGVSSSTGIVTLCKGLERGIAIEVAAWRDVSDAVRVRRTLDDRLTVVRVPVPTLTTVASRSLNLRDRVTVSGTVADSVTGSAVPEARVTFLGTPFEGATDSTGRFLVGGLTRGEYMVEVSTPFLDSIGAVSRRVVTLSDSVATLSLFIPGLTSVMSATCGSADVSGVVVGRLTSRSDAPIPPGMQVVAEWSEEATAAPARISAAGAPTAARLNWVRAPVEGGGTFRVCGVPVGRALTLRTEAETDGAMAALPQIVRLADTRRFARSDLVLDSSVVAPSVFTGAVIADSTGTPLENAEVLITDLNRSTLTNAKGAFRLTDIPVGPHLVNVRKVGHAPMLTTITFAANRTFEQRVLLPKAAATTLSTVSIVATGNGAPAAFDERRKNGIGHYLNIEQLDKQGNRRLSDVLVTMPSVSIVSGRGGNGYIVGKRAPMHIKPRGGGGDGSARSPGVFSDKDLVEQGYYCPTAAERVLGLECACYAQVYIDDHLMNVGRPTEPFDINTIPTGSIAGFEFYASAAQTPGRYSNLQARCGVVLIWLRKT